MRPTGRCTIDECTGPARYWLGVTHTADGVTCRRAIAVCEQHYDALREADPGTPVPRRVSSSP